MDFTTTSSPHIPLPNRVDLIMGQVILALTPGVAAMVWYFGWGVLVNILIAGTTALVTEAVFLKIRNHPVLPAVGDLSALLTGILLAIALPPLLPWWITVLGSIFAIAIVKQLYGGLGQNPFNPAMAGYVLLLVSFPVQMTQWLSPEMLAKEHLTLLESIKTIFTSNLPPHLTWDAISSATPLDEMRNRLGMNQMITEIRESPLWGDYGGKGWEWIGNWFLLGGIFLLWRKIIRWHVPVSMLLGLLVISGMFWLADQETYPFPAFHMFSGGAIIGAFFIATDPVTGCSSPRGQLIYGASIGVLVFIIRTWGGYPDAVAFAVLLMNMAAPTIDYYTRPKVFGEQPESDTRGHE